MGGDQVTTLNLLIVGVDAERNLLMLRGAVPGANGSMVMIREAVKG
jgi:large subunit ribosomal protein L3